MKETGLRASRKHKLISDIQSIVIKILNSKAYYVLCANNDGLKRLVIIFIFIIIITIIIIVTIVIFIIIISLSQFIRYFYCNFYYDFFSREK